jgi:hypothetical protein
MYTLELTQLEQIPTARLTGRVDHDNSVIRGVPLLTIGPLKGWGMEADQTTLRQVKALMPEQGLIWQAFSNSVINAAGASATQAQTLSNLADQYQEAKDQVSRKVGEGFADTERDSLKAATEAVKEFTPLAEYASKLMNDFGLANWPTMWFPIFDKQIKETISWILKAQSVWKGFMTALVVGGAGIFGVALTGALAGLAGGVAWIKKTYTATVDWAKANDAVSVSLERGTVSINRLTMAQLAANASTKNLTLAEIEEMAAARGEAEATEAQAAMRRLDYVAREQSITGIREMTMEQLQARAATLDAAAATEVGAAASNLGAAGFRIEGDILSRLTLTKLGAHASTKNLTLGQIEAMAAQKGETASIEANAAMQRISAVAAEQNIKGIRNMTLEQVSAKSATLGNKAAVELGTAATNLCTAGLNTNVLATGEVIAKSVAAKGILGAVKVGTLLLNEALGKLLGTLKLLGGAMLSPIGLGVEALAGAYMYWSQVTDSINEMKKLGDEAGQRVSAIAIEREGIKSTTDQALALGYAYQLLAEQKEALANLPQPGSFDFTDVAADKIKIAQQGLDEIQQEIQKIESIDPTTQKPGPERLQLYEEISQIRTAALEKELSAQDRLVFLENQRTALAAQRADLQQKADLAAAKVKPETVKMFDDAEDNLKRALAQSQFKVDAINAQRENESNVRVSDLVKNGIGTKLPDQSAKYIAEGTQEQQFQGITQAAIDDLEAKKKERQPNIDAFESTQFDLGTNEKKQAQVDADIRELTSQKRKDDMAARSRLLEIDAARQTLDLKTRGAKKTLDEAHIQQDLIAQRKTLAEQERDALAVDRGKIQQDLIAARKRQASETGLPMELDAAHINDQLAAAKQKEAAMDEQSLIIEGLKNDYPGCVGGPPSREN